MTFGREDDLVARPAVLNQEPTMRSVAPCVSARGGIE